MLIVRLLLLVALVSCSKGKITEEDKQLQQQAVGYFTPIQETMIDVEKNKELITLGKKLYMEPKLSASGTISCNSCHRLDNFGVDSEPTSPGHDGTRGDRNSPTTFNAALNFVQFWDGRAKDLEEQATGPLLNPIEHGLKNDKQVLTILKSNGYMNDFQKAFQDQKDPVTTRNLALAIAAFERTLLTPSPFDAYLNGDIHALDSQQREGLKKFIAVGCTQCHNGPGLGGNSFQKMGHLKVYKMKDQGRYVVTKKSRDKFKFKVPGLRNIVHTGPYLHDGSVASLDDTIKIMAEYQLGKQLSKDDIADIRAFLASLTGK